MSPLETFSYGLLHMDTQVLTIQQGLCVNFGCILNLPEVIVDRERESGNSVLPALIYVENDDEKEG